MTMTPPERLARRLSQAMERRHWTQTDLAHASGVSTSTICALLKGQHLTLHTTVVALGDAVHDDLLAVLSAEARQAVCAKCGTVFIRGGKNAAKNRYCSPPCAHSDYRVNRREYRVRFFKMQLNRTQEAIARMCRACEWDGICKDASCPLRAHSPFELIQLRRRAAT